MQDAADVPARDVGKTAVPGVAVEQRLTGIPERHMTMHTRAVVLEDRLRHEGQGLAGLPSDVLEDVLKRHELIGHRQQRVEPDANLVLTARGDLVVMQFDGDANTLERERHIATHVLVVIHRRNREVPLLGAGLVAKVRALVGAGVPFTFNGVDHVERAIGLRVETNIVEHEELSFGTKECGVGNASGPEVSLGLRCDITRITRVALVRHRVGHVAVDDGGLVLHERIHVHGVGISNQHHV